MKKILLSLGFLLFVPGVWAQSSYGEHAIARAVERGDTLFFAFVGGALPRPRAGVEVTAGIQSEKLGWSGNAVQYGLGGIYFANAYWGYGLEASGVNGEYASVQVAGDSYKSAADQWNGIFLLRFNLNPYQTVRFYVPLGGGIAYTRSRWQKESEKWVERDVSFTYFAGLGVEVNLQNPAQSIGLEARYTRFGLDSREYAGTARFSGKPNCGYLSILLKLNYRF